MLFKRKNPIGLDIGSSYIKIARIDETRAGYELALFDMMPIQPGIVSEGVIVDKANLIKSLKELLNKTGIKKEDAVICVSGHSSVVIKTISLPLMTEEELTASIKYEAEQYMPFDINEVYLDFEILCPRPENDQMDVVIAAVRMDVMNDYVDSVKAAGLSVIIVDTDSFALSNACEVNYDISELNNIAMINIGASITNINILQNGVPTFTRHIAIGSNVHTERLESALDISREDAERIKKGHSIENISPEVVNETLIGASDEIYAEIYKSFEYYKSSIGEADINRIILGGGASLIKGFPEGMEERLGIRVEVMDPFKNIKLSDKLDSRYIKDIAPIAAVVVGLALRRQGDK